MRVQQIYVPSNWHNLCWPTGVFENPPSSLLIWTSRVEAGNTDAQIHVYPHLISEVEENVINSKGGNFNFPT